MFLLRSANAVENRVCLVDAAVSYSTRTTIDFVYETEKVIYFSLVSWVEHYMDIFLYSFKMHHELFTG